MTGNPWTNVRYFSSFVEADTLRSSLNQSDTSGTLEIKVKRCGEGGTQFVVKTRQCQKLDAAATALDEAQENIKKTSKKARKTKN